MGLDVTRTRALPLKLRLSAAGVFWEGALKRLLPPVAVGQHLLYEIWSLP